MKGIFLIGLLSLITALVMPVSSFAQSQTPNFPTCANPNGTIAASYANGTHGIAGDTKTYSGEDTVYNLENGNSLQCFCNGQTGVQTNWWNVGELSQDEIQNLENQGWVYVPDGTSWGLSDSAYMAYNIYGSCGGGTPNTPSIPGNPNTPFTCTDTAPTTAPVITNITYGQNNATLTWTKAGNPVTGYYIYYGVEQGKYIYSSPSLGNITTYTINNLSGGVTYYFVIEPFNGCKTGPFSSEVNTKPNGGQVSGIAEGFTPTAGNNPEVQGVSAANALGVSYCGRCFWWPILVVEGVLLIGLYFFLKKRRMSALARFAPGAAVAILAYVFFVLYNNGKCPFGVMDFKLFVIPCKYFWAVDGVLYLAIAFIFTKVKTSKSK